MARNELSQPQSPTVLLITGIALGVAATSLWNHLQKGNHNNERIDSKNTTAASATTTRGSKDAPSREKSQDRYGASSSSFLFPQELRDEQLSRHTLFFGSDGMQRLKDSKICVVGAGGVGSHTVCSLIRAGVGYIRVIDFDQVSLSSLNRHACATLADVGTSKVQCLVQYAAALCPDPKHCTVEGRAEMYTAETGPNLLLLEDDNNGCSSPPKWDLIIDAIDDVPTKAQLVYDAWKRGIRMISCMGSGGKADFTRLHVSDLKSASRDPLATKLRVSLKKLILLKQQQPQPQKGNTTTAKDLSSTENDLLFEDADRLAIVFSSEQTMQKLADLTDEQKATGSSTEYGAIKGMRVRVLPVLGTMPAIMGQAIADWALAELGQRPFSPVTGERISRNVRHKLFQKLQTREEKFLHRVLSEHNLADDDENQNSPIKTEEVERFQTLGGMIHGIKEVVWIGPLQIDTDDVEYLLTVWKNRCAVTSQRVGTVLSLVRWDIAKPATCDNLILLAQHAKALWDEDIDKNKVDPRNRLDSSVRTKIEIRLASCHI